MSTFKMLITQPIKNSEITKELKLANQVSTNLIWWGSDYDHKSDVLVFHALNNDSQRDQIAHLYIFGPHYLQRPALIGKSQFILGRSSAAPVPYSIARSKAQIITIRVFDRNNLEDTADFVVVCDDLEFHSSEFLYDAFHQDRLIAYADTQDRCRTGVATHLLNKLDGRNLSWYSMDSRFTSELVLSVEHSTEISHLIFDRPFFINLPKTLHNAVIRPASEEDLINISSFFGARREIGQYYGRTNYSRYQKSVVTVRCDEGHFFVYNHGIGFRYKDTFSE